MLLLQLFPSTGVLLMILGGSLLAGLLVHVFLLALFAEAMMRRISRAWIVIPLAAYGAYYAAYLGQAWEISSKSAELRAANPGKILPFDPAIHSLVTKDARPWSAFTRFRPLTSRIQTSVPKAICHSG